MLSSELRSTQGPLKLHYREDPAAAQVTSHASAELRPGRIQVGVETGGTVVEAGLHSSTGGDGTLRCSADMLLEALVACAGVTLQAVATSMGIPLRGGRIRAEGDWDARGTLGVSREVPVGFTAVRLLVALDTDATPGQIQKLLELTERFCVVGQTLTHAVPVEVQSA
jgi:uncharacterized OsmC-like protein